MLAQSERCHLRYSPGERAYRGGDVGNLCAGCIVRLADGGAAENQREINFSANLRKYERQSSRCFAIGVQVKIVSDLRSNRGFEGDQ